MAAVSAIVLAAGRSSRMGRPKALLPIGGEPMIARTLAAVSRSHVDEVVLVLGHEAEAVRRALPPGGMTVVVNPEWEAGISASIRAGIRAAKPTTTAYLIVLGDVPFVSPATINGLLRRWEGGRPTTIHVPTYRGARGNPVLLARSLAAELEALTGDVGARAIFDRHVGDLREVPVDDAAILLDVDTPEDLAAIEEGFASGREPTAVVAGLVGERLGV